ncbi:caspase family protein [Algoriphagus sp. H41]|uniref:Caspase family protein n=1 Tax=Algoriphagus oliviformis TaxID=2811231 RepID=A0ABS3C7L3_9BACT|nr:caspase family protein [Algoriphagus oliviformis]MBN7813109.1 caspase family protein [Algoriphagus oliviformis]
MGRYAVLLGNDILDREHYGSDFGLNAPMNDLDVMGHICDVENISFTKLYNSGSNEVQQEIVALSQNAVSGDFVVIYFSGHGTQIPDFIGDELDGYSESWCLYDRCFIDNEINSLLCEFKKGVRILVISDSCHSGSIAKLFPGHKSEVKVKTVSDIYDRNKNFYDSILRSVGPSRDPRASVISISACLDSQEAEERNGFSDFTKALSDVWNHGLYQRNYVMFTSDIGERTPNATPQITQMGFNDISFINSKPFKR